MSIRTCSQTGRAYTLLNMNMDCLLADGWVLKSQRGSHRQYVHPVKPGKVTLPNHTGDLDPRTVKSIWKQAGINERRTK